MAEKNRTWESPANADRMEQLRRISAEAEAGGGAERREREHKAGKLSARERIELLLDEGTFEELDKFVRHRCVDFGMEEQRPQYVGTCFNQRLSFLPCANSIFK